MILEFLYNVFKVIKFFFGLGALVGLSGIGLVFLWFALRVVVRYALRGQPVVRGKIQEHDASFLHESEHIEPTRRRAEHSPEDVALEVGLQAIAGGLQDARCLGTVGVEDLVPLRLEERGERLQECLVKVRAWHEQVGGIADGEP